MTVGSSKFLEMSGGIGSAYSRKGFAPWQEEFKSKGLYVHPNTFQAMKTEWKQKCNRKLGEDTSRMV